MILGPIIDFCNLLLFISFIILKVFSVLFFLCVAILLLKGHFKSLGKKKKEKKKKITNSIRKGFILPEFSPNSYSLNITVRWVIA